MESKFSLLLYLLAKNMSDDMPTCCEACIDSWKAARMMTDKWIEYGEQNYPGFSLARVENTMALSMIHLAHSIIVSVTQLVTTGIAEEDGNEIPAEETNTETGPTSVSFL